MDSVRRGLKYRSKALFVAEPVPHRLICSGVKHWPNVVAVECFVPPYTGSQRAVWIQTGH